MCILCAKECFRDLCPSVIDIIYPFMRGGGAGIMSDCIVVSPQDGCRLMRTIVFHLHRFSGQCGLHTEHKDSLKQRRAVGVVVPPP